MMTRVRYSKCRLPVMAVVVLLLTGACQSEPQQQQQQERQPSPQQPQGATVPKESSTPRDTWSRSLECADRGERLAKRIQQDFATSAPEMATFNNWTTHYNSFKALLKGVLTVFWLHVIAEGFSPPLQVERIEVR